MQTNKKIDAAMAEAGAAKWGSAAYGSLRPLMDEKQQATAERLCPSPGGVYVAAFPYFAGREAGNISLYARGEDYHRVVMRGLDGVCAALTQVYHGRRFVPLADASPLPEKAAAVRAGIGVIGQNSLLYCGPYGSFVFLGCILTDMPLEDTGSGMARCAGCFTCVGACPTGALKLEGERVTLDPMRCLSAVTQKKGALTTAEQHAVRAGNSVWGCDLCQLACPMNERVPRSPIGAFTGEDVPLLVSLQVGDVRGLDADEFKKRFGERAFSWRGKAVIERNLKILQD